MNQVPRFIGLADETPDSFQTLLARAAEWKKAVKRGKVDRILDGSPAQTTPRVLAMVFQKPSNRTRVSFELAMHHLGGKALYLSPQEIGLGKRESTRDIAKVLGRYVHAIMARVFSHADVEALADFAGVPVINGLSDLEHPCQGLGDFQTILEQGGKPGAGKTTVSFVGDGNNVCHSLMLGAALLKMKFRWIGPPGYEPAPEFVSKARALAPQGGVTLSHNMSDLNNLEGSDFVYTDVWTSMGDEAEADVRHKAFRPFQLNAKALSSSPSAHVMHCLPAHRGDEITDEVMDGAQSVVFDQAENRLYAQMAVLERVMGR